MKFSNTLFSILLLSSIVINTNAEETYIGDVSMGEIKQSPAFVQMKKITQNHKQQDDQNSPWPTSSAKNIYFDILIKLK